MGLKNWLKSNWLVEHKSSPQEIDDLLKAADRDLVTSKVAGLDPDWRLNIAYSAALHSATAALAAEGYRATRESHHFRTIQSLAYTIKADSKLIAQLDSFRKKRNIGTYEIAGAVSEQEAREMVSLAIELLRKVDDWLRDKHPQLSRNKS